MLPSFSTGFQVIQLWGKGFSFFLCFSQLRAFYFGILAKWKREKTHTHLGWALSSGRSTCWPNECHQQIYTKQVQACLIIKGESAQTQKKQIIFVTAAASRDELPACPGTWKPKPERELHLVRGNILIQVIRVSVPSLGEGSALTFFFPVGRTLTAYLLGHHSKSYRLRRAARTVPATTSTWWCSSQASPRLFVFQFLSRKRNTELLCFSWRQNHLDASLGCSNRRKNSRESLRTLVVRIDLRGFAEAGSRTFASRLYSHLVRHALDQINTYWIPNQVNSSNSLDLRPAITQWGTPQTLGQCESNEKMFFSFFFRKVLLNEHEQKQQH